MPETQQEKVAGEIVAGETGIDVDVKKRGTRQGLSTPAVKVPKAVPFLP